MTKDKLIELGGKEWIKDTMHCIYINGYVIADIIDFRHEDYNTGMVKYATIGGDHISNSRANGLKWALQNGKFWYDVNDSNFHSRDLGDDLTQQIIAAIEAK